MCDKHDKTIIKTLKWDEVYIIKYIAKSFNEFVLTFIVHSSHSEIVFFCYCFKYKFICSNL